MTAGSSGSEQPFRAPSHRAREPGLSQSDHDTHSHSELWMYTDDRDGHRHPIQATRRAYGEDVDADRFARAVASIDAANGADPTVLMVEGRPRPKAQAEGELV